MYIIPYAAWTNFTPALPSFYWDVYSAEQRIKQICHELHKMSTYADYLAGLVKEVDERTQEEIEILQQETEQAMVQLRGELNEKLNLFEQEIRNMIAEMSLGSVYWDTQTGTLESSVKSQRDMFNDVTVHSYNLEQLDEVFDELDMSVDDLADCGLNVKGFALVNHVLKDPEGLTGDLIYHDPEGTPLSVRGLNAAKIDQNGYVFVGRD